MTPAIPAVLIGLVACSMQQCGPTPKESGDAILMVLPLVVASAMAVQWLLLRLWRPAKGSIALDWGRGLILCGLLLFPSAYAFLTDTRPSEWFVMAYWLFGTSYLAVLLFVTRVWLFFGDARLVFFAPHLALSAIFALPALPLALGLGGKPWQDVAEAMWIFPGFGGWVPGGLFLVLLVEALWRRSRALKLERSG
jgi:hypothetical protein